MVWSSGYNALALLTSGFVVPFPHFYRYALWLQWGAHLKYTFQVNITTPLHPSVSDSPPACATNQPHLPASGPVSTGPSPWPSLCTV